MPQISIHEDVKAAMDAGRLTWAQAGEVTDLRRELAKLTRQRDALLKKARPIQSALDKVCGDLAKLEALMRDAEASDE